MKTEKGFIATCIMGRNKYCQTAYALVEVQCEVVGGYSGTHAVWVWAEVKAASCRGALSGGAVGFQIQGGLYSALLAAVS